MAVKAPTRYFDLYVRTGEGFVATKGDLIAVATGTNFGPRRDKYDCRIYRSRQNSKRVVGFISGYSIHRLRVALRNRLEALLK